MEEDGYDILFKIILVGDTSVGKTNIISKYLKNLFQEDFSATIGVEFSHKQFLIDNHKIKAQIWDTAGQERYKAITKAYYKGAKGAFIVYDIANKKTFDDIEKWISDLRTNSDENLSIILIGNKTDLNDKREVTTEEGKNKAELYKFAFIETSAFNGNNIEKAFNELITDVYKKNHEFFEKKVKIEINKENKTIELDKGENENDLQEKGKKWCCF